MKTLANATLLAISLTVSTVCAANDSQVQVANQLITELNHIESLAAQGRANSYHSATNTIDYNKVLRDIHALRAYLFRQVSTDWKDGRRDQIPQNLIDTEVSH